MRILNPAGRDATQVRATADAIPATGLRQVSGTDYEVTDDDATVLCSTMTAPVTVTLPRAATSTGRTVTVRKNDSGKNPVTIRSEGGDPIAGQTWVSLITDGEFVQLQSDGTAWQVVLHF